MTLATKDVVSSFVDAWDYVTGQYPGHLHARTPGLAVSLSQTNCSFFNMLVVDRPIDSAAELHGVFAEARRQDAQCPHDSMVVVCPEWLPDGA